MRTVFLCLLLIPSLASAVPFEGTVVDKDGKPPNLAVVQVEPVSGHALNFIDLDRPEFHKTPALPVGPDGHFAVELATGAWRVWFRAPGHRGLSTIVFVSATDKRLPRASVALGRERPVEWFGAPMVEFPSKNNQTPPLEMTKEKDGTWTLTQTSSVEEVRYVLRLETKESPEWVVNPGAPAVFENSYFSVAQVKGGRFTIRFDPESIHPSGRELGEVTFDHPESTQARIADLARAFERLRYDAYRSIEAAPDEQKRELRRQADSRGASRLSATYLSEQAPKLLREVAAVLFASMWLPTEEERALQAKAVGFVPATSWAWSVYPPAQQGGLGSFGFDGDRWPLIERLAKSHPDANVRAGAVYALAEKAKKDGREKLATRLKQQVLTKYADLPTVKWALRREKLKRTRSVGAEFPDLALKTLDGKEVNAASMKGRLTLIEFSAWGCGACTSLIPEMQKIRESVPAEKLRMITITLGTTPKTLKQLLEKQPPQKWEHVALEDSDEVYDRFKAWEVWYYPTVFVVDENGMIAAVDEDLRKNNELARNFAALLRSRP